MTLKPAMVPLALVFALLLIAVDGRAANISSPKTARLASLPSDAAIVYVAPNPRRGKLQDIFVTNERGGNVTQITSNSKPLQYEHVAVSPDRKRIAYNIWIPDPGGRPRPIRSLLWILDLEGQTEAQLVADFYWAGQGGIDWDQNGYIYFAAIVEKSRRPKSDLYRIRYDGTDLQQLTDTRRDEVDVAVSDDGAMMTYIKSIPEPPRGIHEVWVANVDGSNARRVYKSGQVGTKSAHDPEFSPDNGAVVFSVVNPNYRNFRNNPVFNTAHDLYIINIDGGGLRRITPEGGIQIIPDWLGDMVVYSEISEADDYIGMAMIESSGSRRIRFGPEKAHSPKWIPPATAAHGGSARPAPGVTQPAARAQTISRAQVIVTQVLLAQIGYDLGPPDGVIGAKTRSAIRSYQASNGLTVNGEITEALVEKLADTLTGN